MAGNLMPFFNLPKLWRLFPAFLISMRTPCAECTSLEGFCSYRLFSRQSGRLAPLNKWVWGSGKKRLRVRVQRMCK